MFFDFDKINNFLDCKDYEERLDEPTLLPCGEQKKKKKIHTL
jgi:hypothetical protein